VGAPFGWVTARQADQLLLNIALDFDLVGTRRLGLRVQGGQESFGDESLANASDCSYTERKLRGNLVIGRGHSVRVIGEQEDAGVGDLPGSDLAFAE
jgi:hypothetical protein